MTYSPPVGEQLAEVDPLRHLGGEAHDQQQRRIVGRAERVVLEFHTGVTVARRESRAMAADYRRDMTVFGVHAGLQHTTADELKSVWTRIEDLGFGWISIWDHFYGATGRPDDAACLEAVAMHAALACSTSKVRCGSLVYSIGYRHPAVLAKAITAIDQLSGGRADMGIGAGWAVVEYEAYGIPFPD